ncbi:unnamed protein product, partial [Heterosigma akashiwo]
MGHMSESRIRDMVKEGLIPETDINLKDKLNFCSTCAKAKITKSDHSSRSPEYTADRPLARVHTDVAGPICRDYKGNKFFVVFKDEHTRFCRVFFMKQKSDILPHFVTYCNAIRRAVDDPQLQVQRVRLDNGREYNEKMTNHCDKLGIIMEKTGRDDPRSNGIAERTNRSVMDMTRTVMMASNLPRKYWSEAVLYSAHTLNRAYTRSIFMSPYEKLFKKKPSV